MTPSLSRRAAHRQNDASQSLIVFRVQQEWFALPLHLAFRVAPLGQVYGAAKGGLGLTRFHDQEVLVLDLEHRIFGMSQPLLAGTATAPVMPAAQRHLLLIQTAQGELIGLPLNAPPSLRRVPQSAFAPLPPAFLRAGRVRCVSALILGAAEEPPLFLLNPNQLLEFESASLPLNF